MEGGQDDWRGKRMLDLVSKRYWFFVLSAMIILPGVVSLLLPGGIRPGIDFTSGTIMDLRFEQAVDTGELRHEFAVLGHPEAIVQRSGENTYVIRTLPLQQVQSGSAEEQQAAPSERESMVRHLSERFGPVDVLAVDHVSPLIAEEIVRNSILAVGAASVGILLYLWWAFRKVKAPWRYGTCAVIALLHDSLLILGVFSILGRLFGTEVDSLFITAVLTVIGFSVHDTIVVFDRIRENLARHQGEPFEDVVNHSLVQTLGRSLNTSLTVLLTLVALRLFGGVTIQTFVLALLIGVATGTYSSIFNASMLLVVWENGELGRFWRWLTRRQAPARVPA